MTVVVTGATGFVGTHLVWRLLAEGRHVRAVLPPGEDSYALADLAVEIVEGDVREPASLRSAFQGANAVYHLAAFISLQTDEWPLVEAINVTGTRHVVEACLAANVSRLIHFSSFHAMVQQPTDRHFDEERPLVECPHSSPYDRSKAAAEREIQAGIDRGLDAVILNPTGIIGPHDYRPSHFGATLLDLSVGRLPFLINGGCNWVDVRDVVEAALRARQRAPRGAKYLLAGTWVSLKDIARTVEQFTGVPAPKVVLPMWVARTVAPFSSAIEKMAGKRPRFTLVSLRELSGNRHISYERAARELDYRPRPFRQTLADTLQWFADTGRLSLPAQSSA